jgi:hypothetical protein
MSVRTIEFTHVERNLQVSAAPDSEGWKVRVLENGRPATGVVYSISHETNIDARLQAVPADLVDELMLLARTDVERERVRLV